VSGSPLTALSIIAVRELVRFWRQPARVVAAVGTPLLLWLLLGSGLAGAMRSGSAQAGSYGAFLLPGMMSLVVVFASMFAAIALIEDRGAGWLQAVLVSPAPRWSVALGKILGGAILAWGQAVVLLAPYLAVVEVLPPPRAVLAAALGLFLTSVAITALGLALAWRSRTVAGFHAVMNLLLLPMWLLSSALFPPAGAAGWLRALMRANPMTWCNEAIRGPLAGNASWWPPALVAALATCLVAAAILVMRRGAAD
jgi:ABC-2 type transport system permease protein